MKRMMLTIYRDPDMGSSGGSPQSASPDNSGNPQPAAATAAAPGSGTSDPITPAAGEQAPAANKSQQIADLHSRLEKGETLSPDELNLALSGFEDDSNSNDVGDGSNPKDPAPNPADPLASLSDDDKTDMKKAFDALGAKSISELSKKALELVNKDRAEGGQIGRQNKQLHEAIQGQNRLISDILDGKPEALAMAAKLLKREVPASAAQGVIPPGKPSANTPATPSTFDGLFLTDEQINNSLDPELVGKMNGQLKQVVNHFQTEMKAMREQIEPVRQQMQRQTQAAERERAATAVMTELAELADKFPQFYNPEKADVRELLAQFHKTGDVDPRIKELIDTAIHFRDNGHASVAVAHRDRFYDRVADHASAIIQARKDVREKILNQEPTRSVAQNVQGSQQFYTQASLEAIADGKAPFPKEWFGADGEIDVGRIPADARTMLGL